ncbi:MAG: cysteine--tRNA ligase [Planctomycetota bacterium]
MPAPGTPTPRFYNTLTNQLEDFVPLQPGKVTMYNCGPTVYDFAHIGNFKTFLFADVLRRFLELIGHEVHQVMNLTDVGHMTDDALADGGGQDKMAAASQRLLESKKAGEAHAAVIDDPNDPYQVAQFYIDAFLEDGRTLGLKVIDEHPQNMPRATEHIRQMLEMIGTLIARDHAYVAEDGATYFRVESFPDYGQLSGNDLSALRGGAGGRVDAATQAIKQHPADFMLWKRDPSHLMKWDPRKMGLTGAAAERVAELGEGYPGWHIECSTMAMEVLGSPVIDIHTGGEDLIFPHHECEIAQSRGATGRDRFASFWMHARHMMVEGQKMSKRTGNFFTVRQILDGELTSNPVDPAVLRFELIKANYRSRMDFSRKGLLDSASAVKKLRGFAESVGYDAGADAGPIDTEQPAVARFIECLADDLNIAGALGVVFEFIAEPPPEAEQARNALAAFDHVLGVLPGKAESSGSDDNTAAKCAALDAAREAKDFATADAIRDELQAAGYEVKTGPDGTVATPKLA